jgi:hypothetical protein
VRATVVATASLGLALLLAAPAPARAITFGTEVEAGVAWQGYNDVRIPGDTGTQFSLVNDLTPSAAPVFRVSGGATLAERHALRLTWAPVRLSSRGTLREDVRFSGETFPAGSQVQAGYRFDSYRLTYRYGILRSERLEIDLGATAFVRDAGISLQGVRYAEKTNVGFVPLLSFRLAWAFAPPVSLLVDGDGIGGGPGRAEDVLVALDVKVRPGVSVRAGYRFIEGGADTQEVYNFALVNHVIAGLAVAF